MDNIKKRLEEYPEVSFIENLSFEELKSDMIKDYQEEYKKITGKEISLSMADPERLKLYTCAVWFYQAFQYIDKAGKMGLLKYSRGDFLEELGAMKKSERNPAKKAVTTLKFTLSEAQNKIITIPKGTRTKVGNLYFETTETKELEAGKSEIEIPASCQTEGSVGNGYLPGEIKILADPISYVASVVNTTQTQGGADIESDEEYAQRIYLSPSSFSTAGAEDAYKYHAKTYNQQIKDCYVDTENPGEVDIYIILEDGTIPDNSFLEGLYQYLSAKNIRPLTDNVIIKAPETVHYNIDLTYYVDIEKKEMLETIKTNVEQEIKNYISWQKEKIGRDINSSYLMYCLIRAGVKWADIRQPVFKEISKASLAIPDSINVVYGGLENG